MLEGEGRRNRQSGRNRVAIFPDLESGDTAFQDSADLFSNTRWWYRRRILYSATAILDFRCPRTIETSDDDLLRIGCDNQVWIVGNDDDLTCLLAFPEIIDQAWIDRKVVEIVIRLVDDQRTMIVLFGLEIEQQQHNAFLARREILQILFVVFQSIGHAVRLNVKEPVRELSR